MSLTALVAMVVIGIAAIVAAVHYTGGSRPARLADNRAARQRFAEDYPDDTVFSVKLTESGNAAFLQLMSGRVGVVHAVGGKFLTRPVSAADLAATPRASGRSITIRLRDFTWGGGTFTFENEADAAAVEEMFKAVRQARIWEKQR